MADLTIWFGQSGTASLGYLSQGPAGFAPIDIDLLPGPALSNGTVPGAITTEVTGSSWSNETVYFNRVLLNTVAGETTVDSLRTWNLVKNAQITSADAQRLYVDGIVHVDAEIGLNSTNDSYLFLNGVKRANVITGGGNDVVEIRTTVYDYSSYSDDFRINTGAGDDYVHLAGLDVAAELAEGDTTYSNWLATGRPLITSGEGQRSFVDLGAGNDHFVGYNSDDFVIGGTNSGTDTAIYHDLPPSGFGYAIGGRPNSKGTNSLGSLISSTLSGLLGSNDSVLYKINLATGATEAVGKVSVAGIKAGTGVDIDALSVNPTDGLLYGFAVLNGKNYGLLKIDPNTAATTLIGGDVAKLKFDPQGAAFDLDGHFYIASAGDLYKVDAASGSYTKIASGVISSKIEGLAFDPKTDLLYGLSQEGSKNYITVINEDTGAVITKYQIKGLDKFADVDGLSFDSAGHLFAEDRISGSIYQIDLGTKTATLISHTLGVQDLTGNGFEALAIDIASQKELTGIATTGGDVITTGAGQDHIFYNAGDGVDIITDFSLSDDVLHITGFADSQIHIDELDGNTFIRFTDNSADGFVDNAVIELQNVIGFDPSHISHVSASDYFLTI